MDRKKLVKYTVAEFRKNTREILNAVDQGAEVHIQRYDRLYLLTPASDTDAVDAAAYAIGVDHALPGADRSVETVFPTDSAKRNKIVEAFASKKNSAVGKPTKKGMNVPKGVEAVDSCPHGYAKGMCKKADCNRKYAK